MHLCPLNPPIHSNLLQFSWSRSRTKQAPQAGVSISKKMMLYLMVYRGLYLGTPQNVCMPWEYGWVLQCDSKGKARGKTILIYSISIVLLHILLSLPWRQHHLIVTSTIQCFSESSGNFISYPFIVISWHT